MPLYFTVQKVKNYQKLKSRGPALRGAWRDHCFPEPFSWFLHETGLESLKITSACCFLLKCQRKDSKKAKEHRQFRGVLGRWRTAAIDRTTFHACQGCRKLAVFAVSSRLWSVIWRVKAFRDQQCQFLLSAIELSETADFVYNFVQKPYASEQRQWRIWRIFPFNFFMKFSQKMPLYFTVQKVKNNQKLKSRGPALRGAWRDHCFPEPFSWFLHETGLESLKITSACCFLLKCQRKDSKKAKEHRQFRGVLGRWRTATIDRTTFHACQRCRKMAVFAVSSRLWSVIWRVKAFRDQQCQFLTRNKSLSSENESNCSTTSEWVRTDLILPRGAGLEHGRCKQSIFSLSIFCILVERLSF